MGQTKNDIISLVLEGKVKFSEHGYDELAEDGIFAKDVIDGVQNAVELEDYPDYPKGPCVLLMQKDRLDKPIHVVWGVPKGKTGPAVIVTAYRPDPLKWNSDFTRRLR